MGISFTWLGHSAFEMTIDGHLVAFDPFLSNNPTAAVKPEALIPEIIFLSHAHDDHLGDTVAIAKRAKSLVVANFEICTWMGNHGVKDHHAQNPGGGYDHGFVHAKLTMAHHSSSFPDGAYGGEPTGFLLTPKETRKRIYFAGDTALFLDMQLIGEEGIELAFLPIGDNYTMGPTDSLRAIRMIKPKFVVPMHYNTWDDINQDVDDWARRVRSETEAEPIVLQPGGSYTLQ
mgnify:CR=1 FL=1